MRNIAQCRKCQDIIESKHRHDFVSCKCGAIFIDGGQDYQRYGAKDMNDVILLDEMPEAPEPTTRKFRED
jgi:hypothetical protein